MNKIQPFKLQPKQLYACVHCTNPIHTRLTDADCIEALSTAVAWWLTWTDK